MIENGGGIILDVVLGYWLDSVIYPDALERKSKNFLRSMIKMVTR